MTDERATGPRAHRHPALRRAAILAGEVALGGLLGAAITVLEDRVFADHFAAAKGVPTLP